MAASSAKLDDLYPPSTPARRNIEQRRQLSPLELQMKIHEDFAITEKAPTRAFSLLKAPTSTLHLRHYEDTMLNLC